MVRAQQKNQRPPWQVMLAWFVGLCGVANVALINIFPIEQVRVSPWVHMFLVVNGCNCLVTSNTAYRETIPRRKIAWILMSAASFMAFYHFIFTTLLHYDDMIVNVSIFIFMILGLATYFPKRIWSIGNTWRVIFDCFALSFLGIAALQSLIYSAFGVNSISQSAAIFLVWLCPEIVVLFAVFLLYQRFKNHLIVLIVYSALCIVLADITGLIRHWYPGIYRTSGLPDISLYFL